MSAITLMFILLNCLVHLGSGSLTLTEPLKPLPSGPPGYFSRCTNYDAFAGTTIGQKITRREHLVPKARDPDSDTPFTSQLVARTDNIIWCREASNIWLSFAAPFGTVQAPVGVSVETVFGLLFSTAISAIKKIIAESKAQGNRLIPRETPFYIASGDTVSMYAYNHGDRLTYGTLLTAIEMMQNFVYVTRDYGSVSATINQGHVTLGTLQYQ